MNLCLVVILCVALVELAVRLPWFAPLGEVAKCVRKSIRIVRANAVSDHWKERALGAYARKTVVSSIKLAGLLGIVFMAAAIATVALDQLSSGFQALILSWPGIGISIIVSSLWLVARRFLARGRI